MRHEGAYQGSNSGLLTSINCKDQGLLKQAPAELEDDAVAEAKVEVVQLLFLMKQNLLLKSSHLLSLPVLRQFGPFSPLAVMTITSRKSEEYV